MRQMGRTLSAVDIAEIWLFMYAKMRKQCRRDTPLFQVNLVSCTL